MTCIAAHHVDPTLPANYLAVLTNLLDARTHFHRILPCGQGPNEPKRVSINFGLPTSQGPIAPESSKLTIFFSRNSEGYCYANSGANSRAYPSQLAPMRSFRRPRQQPHPLSGQRDGVFKMRRQAPVDRHLRPFITQTPNVLRPQGHHRLDGEHQPRL